MNELEKAIEVITNTKSYKASTADIASRNERIVMCAFMISLYTIMAIPFVLTVFWAMSILCFGLGVFLPYLFFAENGYGFWRVMIFGTLFHALMAALFIASMKATERYYINIDALLGAAIVEMIIVFI